MRNYADSDCDTVACCYGISKGKLFLKTLRSGQTLHRLGDPNEDLYLMLYLKPYAMVNLNVTILHDKMWISKVGKSAKTCHQRILVGFVKKQLKTFTSKSPSWYSSCD